MGSGSRGACKICGQTGHLTKQCRNALPGGDGGGGGGEAAALLEAPPADDGADSLDLSSDSSDEERRRCGPAPCRAAYCLHPAHAAAMCCRIARLRARAGAGLDLP